MTFGLVRPLESANPFYAFFHGFARLFQKLRATDTLRDAATAVFGPPEWQPSRRE